MSRFLSIRPLSLLLLASSMLPLRADAQIETRSAANLILLGAETTSRSSSLLELVRFRLPLSVQQGRFDTQDGITNTCVQARRSYRGELNPIRRSDVPHCPMIAVFVDGVRISDAGTFLATARNADFDSVEFVSAADAAQRYGLAADGSGALALWTLGRRPKK